MLEFERCSLEQGSFRLEADMKIAAPGRVAVIGPSGGGKSTLLASVGGFLAPVAGRVIWDGRDLGPVPPGERPVTTLFQDQNLFPHLTVFQNVGLGLAPDLRLTNAARGAVEAALGRVGLQGYGARRPSELSGGQVSRVALARALVRARPVICMDEPFSALGPALKDEMLDLVAELLGEALVLMVSHDPEDALRFAPHCVVVAEGRAEGPFGTGALLSDPPESLKAYFGRRGWGTGAS
ncbi:thiamine ABC transporter ATP-binding protein [Ovoidimarina sediminis]|uniref:thiamine ABC transporter ATP-binding protein n=1 Tax=Ovoidimarina sediminis TaxID=3079856 RepID=UPI00291383C7|nr:ATP-binding cassette domain-containing protein [Rhodophyticola sp. MJ-SS7]MDU8942335.1 ATP-binding cassette domain-containing protein [Rhodophyticola sp. MJ-SS7]